PSPRAEDVDADSILGWFDTLKFASMGPRSGRGPMIPLPKPPANAPDTSTVSPDSEKQQHYLDLKTVVPRTPEEDEARDIVVGGMETLAMANPKTKGGKSKGVRPNEREISTGAMLK